MKRRKRFSKSDMIGFIVLSVVLTASILTYHYKDKLFSHQNSTNHISDIEIKELEAFAQQIKKDSIERKNRYNKVLTKKPQLTPFVFDPNTADSNTLAKLGLKEWQISNLLKYRRKGGRWRHEKDFARLYGLKNEEFEILRPFIKIKKNAEEIAKEKETEKKDSLHKTFPKKFPAGTILSLNEADTTMLKGIPGIGSYYAKKICRYRERLGGFVRIEQIKEIEGLPEGIEKWFEITPNATIRKTRINQSSFKELIKHPYLNYEQVKVICNYIRKYGKIKNWEELSNSEHFNASDFERLGPYSSFE